MREFLWLIPALPLLAFLVLIVPGKALPRRAAAIAGTLAPALSAVAASRHGVAVHVRSASCRALRTDALDVGGDRRGSARPSPFISIPSRS